MVHSVADKVRTNETVDAHAKYWDASSLRSSISVPQADFTAQLEAAGNRLVVVDFYATWCGPCKLIAPKLEAMAQEFKDDIVVLKVDVDENEEIAAEYKVEAMPTFVFIKSKAVVTRFSGANEQKVRDSIMANKWKLCVTLWLHQLHTQECIWSGEDIVSSLSVPIKYSLCREALKWVTFYTFSTLSCVF